MPLLFCTTMFVIILNALLKNKILAILKMNRYKSRSTPKPTKCVSSKESDQPGQADPSLCWAHMSFCWFCHAVAHIITINFATYARVKFSWKWIAIKLCSYNVRKPCSACGWLIFHRDLFCLPHLFDWFNSTWVKWSLWAVEHNTRMQENKTIIARLWNTCMIMCRKKVGSQLEKGKVISYGKGSVDSCMMPVL